MSIYIYIYIYVCIYYIKQICNVRRRPSAGRVGIILFLGGSNSNYYIGDLEYIQTTGTSGYFPIKS